jgi:hypothetical protein
MINGEYITYGSATKFALAVGGSEIVTKPEVLLSGFRPDESVLFCVTSSAQRFAFIVPVLPRKAASKVEFVVDLKHYSVGRTTRASVAGPIVESNNLSAKSSPFWPVVVILHSIPVPRIGQEL